MVIEMSVRKTIYLDENLERDLNEASIFTGKKETAIIIEALREYIRKIQGSRKKLNPLYELIGMCEEGREDASEMHDLYLYKEDRK
jgi:hypothetical protein